MTLSVTRRLNEAYVDPLKRGTEEFWQLASTYAGYVARKLVSPTEADDVVQDSMVTAFENLSKVQDSPRYSKFTESDGYNSYFSRWLSVVIKNEVHDRRRKRREIPASQLGRYDDGEFVSAKWEPSVRFLDPFELVESDEAKDAKEAETSAKLDTFRTTLTKRQKQVFDLFRQGMNATEIAKELGISSGNVGEHMNRWRNKAEERFNSDPVATIR